MLAHVKALSLIFWHRHRIGLSAVIVSTGIAVALAWISRLTLSERWMPTILAVAVLPFFSNALYLIAVFVFGFDSDVNQSGSCYPRSFFTLPISTLTLAFIPTLLVAVSLSLLWFILARLILAPLAIQVPLLWPMLLIANIVMAVQIIFWW